MTGPPQPAGPDDSDLVRQARAGSADAFARLVERHGLPLYRFLRLYTAEAGLAEELQQDTFVRCWTKLHLFDCRRPFRPWLLRLAANVVHNRWRDDDVGNGARLEDIVDDRNPAAVVAIREQWENIWDLARQVLPRGCCSALWLFHAEGLAAATIAEVLGKTEGAVRTMLSRSRARLARLLPQCNPFLEVR